ncbi:MAG: hypothetical protein KAH38_06935 [Candidatus Hydrogenedentes bacterium]|nr:hypothetical protein [Candidatus Hydrogenedentota bacterium]
MKYKGQIIIFGVVVVVLSTLGAVWQFYYKDIFEGYKTDDSLRETLEKKHSQLAETFSGYKPELLIKEWQNKMQPWRDAREERSSYFNLGDWYDIDVTPDETRMLKFWYTEESNKMFMGLYRVVYEKMGNYECFPQNMRDVLHVQQESDWVGRDVTMREVQVNLKAWAFGTALTKFLLDSKVTHVRAISIWPRRIPKAYAELLGLQTVGLRFSITARDLIKMLDDLRTESRYFAVDGIKITYPYIAYQTEPQLNVAMLLTQAKYRKPADVVEQSVSTAGRSRSARAARPKTGRANEPGILGRSWIWFKRTVLYMN